MSTLVVYNSNLLHAMKTIEVNDCTLIQQLFHRLLDRFFGGSLTKSNFWRRCAPPDCQRLVYAFMYVFLFVFVIKSAVGHSFY